MTTILECPECKKAVELRDKEYRQGAKLAKVQRHFKVFKNGDEFLVRGECYHCRNTNYSELHRVETCLHSLDLSLGVLCWDCQGISEWLVPLHQFKDL